MKHKEEDEQMALFEWAEYAKCKYPELKYMFHTPNGGKRDIAEAVRFKKMGVKSGVPDIFLPCARGGYHGLWIEMKSSRGKITENQNEFISAMKEAGYKCKICRSCDSAIKAIKTYLDSK